MLLTMLMTLLVAVGSCPADDPPPDHIITRIAAGESPPPMVFEELLQAPAGAKVDWPSLKGKPVVIVFGATWCTPFVKALPHLNRLATKFDDRVIFLYVTPEDHPAVDLFLMQHRTRAWVGRDTDRSVFKSFMVNHIPDAILVDAEGEVAAIERPERIESHHIETLLAGGPLSFAVFASDWDKLGPRIPLDGPEPLFRVVIEPAPAFDMRPSRVGMGIIELRRASTVSMVAHAGGTLPNYVIWENPPAGEFTAIARVSYAHAGEERKLLHEAIETAFDVSIDAERRTMDVYVATVPAKLGPAIAPADPNASGSTAGVSGTSIDASNRGLDEILAALEVKLDSIIIDELNVRGSFDYKVSFEAEDLVESVERQTGIVLTRAKRRVEVMVVTPAW